MTLGITIALTLYAIKTKKDFTYYGASFFIIATALFMFSIFAMLFNNGLLNTFLTTVTAIFYGIYKNLLICLL